MARARVRELLSCWINSLSRQRRQRDGVLSACLVLLLKEDGEECCGLTTGNEAMCAGLLQTRPTPHPQVSRREAAGCRGASGTFPPSSEYHPLCVLKKDKPTGCCRLTLFFES